eukprot:IDg2453t1
MDSARVASRRLDFGGKALNSSNRRPSGGGSFPRPTKHMSRNALQKQMRKNVGFVLVIILRIRSQNVGQKCKEINSRRFDSTGTDEDKSRSNEQSGYNTKHYMSGIAWASPTSTNHSKVTLLNTPKLNSSVDKHSPIVDERN